MIGPVLVKQDKAEAVTNVKNRLNLISSEMYETNSLARLNCNLITLFFYSKRVEAQLNELTQKSETKKQEVMD